MLNLEEKLDIVEGLIYAIKISEIVEDPVGKLKVGMEVHVTFLKDFPNVDEVKIGDLIEVYGTFKGIEDGIAKMRLEKSEDYLKNC